MKSGLLFALLVIFCSPSSAQALQEKWQDLIRQSNRLYRGGDYKQAALLAKRAFDVAQTEVTHLRPDAAVPCAILLAELYKNLSRFPEAESIYKRNLKIF